MPPATVVRIALVFLSGTFSPDGVRSASWRVVAHALPLVYGVDALRQSMSGVIEASAFYRDMAVLIVFSLLFLGIGTWLFGKNVSLR